MYYLYVTGIKECFVCESYKGVFFVCVRNKGMLYLCMTGIKKCFICVSPE